MSERIGTGRTHGQRPAGGMELTLYEATHAPTAWEDPEPWDVAPLINWYRTLPGCGNGGSLHIVTEDENCDDHHVEWCAGYASGVEDTCGAELAGLLGRMDAYARVHAIDLANETRTETVRSGRMPVLVSDIANVIQLFDWCEGGYGPLDAGLQGVKDRLWAALQAAKATEL